MENLKYYNIFSKTPHEARKEIGAGRLKGMTDINPMWRIKMLTETFGMCGIGWKYVINSKRLETGCKGQISAFVDIDLFVKVDGKWSDAIQGTGGASFVTDEKNGLYQSDECFKMALTDALGISCKALGMSADIYFAKDRTKYNTESDTKPFAEMSIEYATNFIKDSLSLEELGKRFNSLPESYKLTLKQIATETKLKLTPKQ
jgi:hypothetical protein